MSARVVNAAQNDTKTYPPYCELCLVKFMTNFNASLHFNGPQHQNKIMLAFHRQPNQNLIWCQTCCVELNTQKALEIHEQSPKHKKKVEAYHEIAEMKKEYLMTLEKPKLIVVVDDKIEELNTLQEGNIPAEYSEKAETKAESNETKSSKNEHEINEFELD